MTSAPLHPQKFWCGWGHIWGHKENDDSVVWTLTRSSSRVQWEMKPGQLGRSSGDLEAVEGHWFCLAVLGFELRALSFLGKGPATRHSRSAF
jgi:hypothetical protein